MEHYQENQQMAFLSGPRQVGKTTTAQVVAAQRSSAYFNWDAQEHRRLILKGPAEIAESAGLRILPGANKPIIVFDELHKYSKWKLFLKGFFDIYGGDCWVLVTGSGRLDVYKRGGDSLMGRYFLYRMHPLTVAELATTALGEQAIRSPRKIDAESFRSLLQFGGFPEPFLKANTRFYNRWQRLRTEQLMREDLRDISRIQEIAQVEIMAEMLGHQTGDLVNFSKLSGRINVSVDTGRRWISTLESLYFCFSVRPWFHNIPKSLRKQPKIYLWDWSGIQDAGARHENFVASHLLKAVHWWTDMGLGTYQLFFIRDKDKREIDFLVTRDNQPWFLLEVKTSGAAKLNKHLSAFQQKTGARHAFQVAFNLDYIDRDCFSQTTPVIVAAKTFLSQLV